MNPALISQLLITVAELYMDYRQRGYELDKQSKEKLKELLSELNKDLKEIDDLETDYDKYRSNQ